MSQPYIGEIRLLPYNFTVAGWAQCNGQLVPISENDTLFALIGTTYGGDGVNTFGLPDLRGREPIHQGTLAGTTYVIGQTGGVPTVTVNSQQMPNHSHFARASTSTGDKRGPVGNVWAASDVTRYGAGLPDVSLAAGAVGPAGGNQPHDNMPPYLALNYQISLFGIFPTQA